MINVREHLQRDHIIYRHTCVNGIYYDSISHRFQHECRTDDISYCIIRDEIQAAGFEFSTECFNDFVASARGVSNESPVVWDRALPESMILPGERFCLNNGNGGSLELLKINCNSYMVTALNGKNNPRDLKLLQILCTNGKQIFDKGQITFDALPYQIEWISLLPPRRINRAVDHAIDTHYARYAVADDISELIHSALRALHENEFTAQFNKLIAEFAHQGISSWALRGIADAYIHKYSNNENEA